MVSNERQDLVRQKTKHDKIALTNLFQPEDWPEYKIMEGVPVYESKGKVKYPICGKCHTPVIWSCGTYRCGNLIEKSCFAYELRESKFVHKRR